MIHIHEYDAHGRSPDRRKIIASTDEWKLPTAKREGLSKTGSFLCLLGNYQKKFLSQEAGGRRGWVGITWLHPSPTPKWAEVAAIGCWWKGTIKNCELVGAFDSPGDREIHVVWFGAWLASSLSSLSLPIFDFSGWRFLFVLWWWGYRWSIVSSILGIVGH